MAHMAHDSKLQKVPDKTNPTQNLPVPYVPVCPRQLRNANSSGKQLRLRFVLCGGAINPGAIVQGDGHQQDLVLNGFI